jgi:hypothetical protein
MRKESLPSPGRPSRSARILFAAGFVALAMALGAWVLAGALAPQRDARAVPVLVASHLPDPAGAEIRFSPQPGDPQEPVEAAPTSY